MRQLEVIGTAAHLSECGKYRWSLQREWHSLVPTQAERRAPCMWVGLNPSTADAFRDDPTIRRMMAFSNAWGYRRMVVCNIFAFRATNPGDMAAAQGIIRTDTNLTVIEEMGRRCSRIICAWGSDPIVTSEDERQVLAVLPLGAYCLGRTKDGSPRHPLYLSADTPLELY